jgi:site-specific recombinase XerC
VAIDTAQSSRSLSRSTYVIRLETVACLLNIFALIIAVVSAYQSRVADEKAAAITAQNLTHLTEHQVAAALSNIDSALKTIVEEFQVRRTPAGVDAPSTHRHLAHGLSQLPEAAFLRVTPTARRTDSA